MFFFPYKIETIFKHWPLANMAIMAVTILMFFVSLSLSEDTIEALILGGTSTFGLIGHLFLHAGFFHLAGNLVFLWVFGNAVCGMTSNRYYPLLYLGFGVLSAAAHIAFDGEPAIGASGAINGVVGMAFAMFPKNGVSVFWYFFMRAGVVELPLWVLAIVWCAFDAFGAWMGGGDIAYFAHLGGFAAGALTGVVGLKMGWVTLTEYDNASLVEVFLKKRDSAATHAAGTQAAQTKTPTKKSWAWEEPMNLKDE